MLAIIGLVLMLFSVPLIKVAGKHYRCHPSGDRTYYTTYAIGWCFCLLTGLICLWFGWPEAIIGRILAALVVAVVIATDLLSYRRKEQG